jgi:hypothetical protein
MAQGYSDITRESDPYALADCETFYVSQLEVNYNLENPDHADEYTLTEAGWYWWSCFYSGNGIFHNRCVPDGPANGPFNTEEEATTDAQDIG